MLNKLLKKENKKNTGDINIELEDSNIHGNVKNHEVIEEDDNHDAV